MIDLIDYTSIILDSSWKMVISIVEDYDSNKRYTDEYRAKIKLVNDQNKILIVDDYINYISEVLLNVLNNIDNSQIEQELIDTDIGLAYNYDLFSTFEEKEFDYNFLKMKTESGFWIGMKYSVFETPIYATWLYKYGSNYYLKVTPIYQYNWGSHDNKEEDFRLFVNEYKPVLNMILSKTDIQKIKDIILTFR